MNRNQKGFTLIELMIVVAIIAILAAIAIPLYLSYTAKAQGTEAMTLMDGVKSAVASYYNEHGAFPTGYGSAGLGYPYSINGSYVTGAGIFFGTRGIVGAEFKSGPPTAKPLRGKYLILSPSAAGGSVTWICKVSTSAMFRYVPLACRHVYKP